VVTISALHSFQFPYSFSSCACIVFLQRKNKGAPGETVRHNQHRIQLQDLLPLNVIEAKSINYSMNLFFNLRLFMGEM